MNGLAVLSLEATELARTANKLINFQSSTALEPKLDRRSLKNDSDRFALMAKAAPLIA
jgi:hypothetical protein